MRGVLVGIGVGPGDPEYMTLKAVKVIGEVDVIAAPGEVVEETTAYKIAIQAVPEMAKKEKTPLFMPMVMDKEETIRSHHKAAKIVEELLDAGKTVGFLTLGDPTVYSTFAYVEQIVKADGYETKYISGITSFCAAAAGLGIPLTEWQEPLHVIPAIHKLGGKLDLDGNYVLMKSGRQTAKVKEMLRESGRNVKMVENCGMESEKMYQSLEEIPDDAGYFSLIIAK